MATRTYSLTKGPGAYYRCNGDSYGTTPTSYNVNTTIDSINNVINRPSNVEKTVPGLGGFRPYTSYQCSGRTYRGSPLGETRRVTTYTCSVPPTSSLREAHLTYGCLATSISFGALHNDPGPPGQEEKDALLTQAYAKVVEGIFDSATNLGEFPEIVRMLANTKRRLVDCMWGTLIAAKRDGKLPEVVKTLAFGGVRKNAGLVGEFIQLVSSLWLEYRYGWRPLMQSIFDLNDALRAVKVPGSKVFVGAASKTHTCTRTVTIGQTAFNSAFKQTLRVEQGGHKRVNRASVAAVLSPSELAFESDVLTTSFELIPLSFVLNWIVDVQSFLMAQRSLKRSVPLTMCTSTWVGSSIQVLGGPPSGGSSVTYHCDTAISFGVDDFSYVRTAVAGFTPTVSTRFDIGAKDTRVIDLIALLAQRLPTLLR